MSKIYFEKATMQETEKVPLTEAAERLIERAGGKHRRADEYAIILLRHEDETGNPEIYMTVTATLSTHTAFIQAIAEGLELQLNNPRPAEPGNSNTPV